MLEALSLVQRLTLQLAKRQKYSGQAPFRSDDVHATQTTPSPSPPPTLQARELSGGKKIIKLEMEEGKKREFSKIFPKQKLLGQSPHFSITKHTTPGISYSV